jgi:hypothetical protein
MNELRNGFASWLGSAIAAVAFASVGVQGGRAQATGTGVGASGISTVNYINIPQAASQPMQKQSSMGSAGTGVPVPFGIMPYAAINLSPGPQQQVSVEELGPPDDDGIPDPPTVTFTFTPHLIAEKVTKSGRVLLHYDRSLATMPCGYTWLNGTYTALGQYPGWATTITDPPGQYIGVGYGDAGVADMNDSGAVIGSIGMVVSDPGSYNNYAGYVLPAYWPAAGTAASQMGVPSGADFVGADNTGGAYIKTPAGVEAKFIDDTGTAYGLYYSTTISTYGNYTTIGSTYEEIWTSPTASPTSNPNSGPSDIISPPYAYILAVSPVGKHTITVAGGGQSNPAATDQLDGATLNAVPAGGASFVGINDGGRYLYLSSWADKFGALQAIPGLQPSGTALGINNNNDVLGLKGPGVYALYTWNPPAGSQPGSYAENILTTTAPAGWGVVALGATSGALPATSVASVAPMNDSRLMVGQIVQTTDSTGVAIPAAKQASMPALFVPAALLVDANRDGNIDNLDVGATTAAAPFRFWVNDGTDGPCPIASESTVQDDLQPNVAGDIPNCQTGHITCARDLENLARLWVYTSGMGTALSSGQVTLGLELQSTTGGAAYGWGPTDGSPAINLYQAAPKVGVTVNTGGADYLTDSNTANAQLQGSYPAKLGTVARNQPFYFTKTQLADLANPNSTAYFLFEGAVRGTGKLVLTFNSVINGVLTKVGESAPVYVDLKETAELYERWSVGDGPNNKTLTANGGGGPKAVASIVTMDPTRPLAAGATPLHYGSGGPAANGLAVIGDPQENDYVLFVHGWNLAPWEKDAFATTMLKRLYWQGYKGKFGTFQWPTTYGSSSNEIFNNVQEITGFDDGEYNAWQSGVPLALLLSSSEPSGIRNFNVFIMAHSMGNIVAGEALRLVSQQPSPPHISGYAAAQAAVSAATYDQAPSQNDALYFGPKLFPIFGPFTPDIYTSWLETAESATSSLESFYNVNDFALHLWNFDEVYKPDNRLFTGGFIYGYGSTDYSTAQNLFYKKRFSAITHLDLMTPMINRYEIMAYDAQPRRRALGEVPDPSGFNPTSLQGIWGTDTLKMPNGLFSGHPWHSAEFRFTFADQYKYWGSLLCDFGIMPLYIK